mmetsp:Transcript_7259/g.24722  ORF Transcript_7259/g.24722 Transcript_7259/m.24722 type:complete len:287 (-) Transcript_7259:286-1146(-)
MVGELLPDHPLEVHLRHVALLEVKAKGLGAGLVVHVVEGLHVRVREGLGGRDALGRVEHEHALEEVHGEVVCVWVELCEGHLLALGQRADVLDRLLVLDDAQVLAGRGPEHVDDEPELLEVVAPREERLAAEELGEDAAHAPHVDGLIVRIVLHQELRRPVPPGDHVLGQLVLLRVVVHPAREAKVADFEVAVLIDEQVAGLEVPVQHARRVDALEAPEHLVHKVLDVVVRQGLLGVDDVVQVRVQQLGHEVHVLPSLRLAGRRSHDVAEAEHVLVVEVAQELELP